MRKLMLLSGALLVTVLALAGGLSNPDAAWAVCFCPSNNAFRTPDDWAQGANCTEARNNLLAKLNQHAYADCGVSTQTCLGDLVIFTACHSIGGGLVQEDGYRFYSCKECTDPVDPPQQ